MRQITALFLLLALSACGGGGDNPNSPSGNGPDLPGNNHSVYRPASPPSVVVKVRASSFLSGESERRLSGREIRVSMVEFRPAVGALLRDGTGTFFNVRVESMDGQVCDCYVVIRAYASPDGTGNGLTQPSFWNGGNSSWMREASREMRIGTEARPPAPVAYAYAKIWALQGTTDDVRLQGDDELAPHGVLVSERLDWRAP
jgi:hypothetical protein